MKEKVFLVLINGMVFWIVSDLFSGIEVEGGLFVYVLLGAIFGTAMLLVRPLINFFTLPMRHLLIVLGSVMLGIVVFLIMNFAIPGINFQEGTFGGFANEYVKISEIKLDMVGNIIAGGVLSGLLSSLLDWLYE